MSDFDLSTLLQCNYGSSAFAVETFTVDSTPIVKETQGRTGTRLKIEVDGYISAADPATLTSLLTVAYADLYADGSDFQLLGIGGNPLVTLYAAQCADGGPHIQWHSTPDSTPICQDFKITVLAEIRGLVVNGHPVPTDTWKLSTRVRPDTLIEIARTGEVNGPNAGSYFLTTVLPVFEQRFPGPNWVTEFEYSTSGDGNHTKAAYRCSARQVATPLPSSTLCEAVDGDSSTRVERDEQYRLLTTYEYDLVVVGSASDLLTNLRGIVVQEATNAGGILWKESSSSTFIKEKRLRCTFVTLSAANGNPLMNWEESLEIGRNYTTYDVKTYAGADPVVVQRAKTVERLVQAGSATCAGFYVKAPSSRYGSFLEPPHISYEDLGDGVQYRTRWNYVMYTSEGSAANALTPSRNPFSESGTNLKFLARTAVDGFIKAGWNH